MKDSLFTTFVCGSTLILRLLSKVRLRRFFCIGLALLMLSCATKFPKETYPTSANISGISRVAIIASANVPDVTYHGGRIPTLLSSGELINILPIGILPGIIEGVVRSGMDAENAKQIEKRVDLTSIEDKITEVFLISTVPAGCFKALERIKSKNQDERLLATSGYDAIIRLTVREMSLDRIVGDYVGFHIHVHGQLKNLRSGQIIWDREEIATSPESHQLDYYKENGLKELNALLEKAGKKLAYDFLYLK